MTKILIYITKKYSLYFIIPFFIVYYSTCEQFIETIPPTMSEYS